MKKKLIESFCLLLFTGILSANAYLADRIHLPEKERAEIEKTTEIASNEKTYDMEELRKGLLAGMGNVSSDTNGVILDYTTYNTHPVEKEPSVEDMDIPKAESVDLSQIRSNVPNSE